MRKQPHKKAEKYRIKAGEYKSPDNANFGAFRIPTKKGVLRIIVSDGFGWDHVSVSLSNRTPTWNEMCFVKDLFFEEEETVIQYHPPRSKYINDGEYVLHMWRPQKIKIELPPSFCV